jgi:hypothetical protein
MARVDTEEPALVVIEVEKIKADSTSARRGDLDLSASVGEGFQRRLEHRPTDRVKDHLRSTGAFQTADERVDSLAFEREELVERGCSRRLRREFAFVDPDDASDPAARADHEQCLSGRELRIFDAPSHAAR